MLKSSKYILTTGCSYTDLEYRSPHYDIKPWPMWPELVGDYLSLPVKNIAKCGAGNDFMLDQLIPIIAKDHMNIDCVMIQWSAIDRWSVYSDDIFLNNPKSDIQNENTQDPHKLVSKERAGYYERLEYSKYLMKRINAKGTITLVQLFFQQCLTIERLCRALGIKCVHLQACGHIGLSYVNSALKIMGEKFTSHEQHMEWMKQVSSLPEYKELYNEKTTMINFPKTSSIPLVKVSDDPIYWSVQHLFNSNRDKYRIGPLDSHPSEDGQNLMAEMFYLKYNEVYG